MNDAALSDSDIKNRGLGSSDPDHKTHGSAGEVFRVFLKLGLTSFGGPIAHLGYYRDELVVRRQWLDETTYADLVALWPETSFSRGDFHGPRSRD
jgi:hypothetical protein